MIIYKKNTAYEKLYLTIKEFYHEIDIIITRTPNTL